MRIGKHNVGQGFPVLVVCEISCSHEGELGLAKKLIHDAAQAGADAVKFQAFEPDDMCPDSQHPAYELTSGPWAGRTLRDLYTEAQTPFEWFPALFECAWDANVTPFASVFSRRGVDMLEGLDCPAYKIASPEITDLALIRYAAATGKPIILSTGMAKANEVTTAVSAAIDSVTSVAAMHCVSGYPTRIEDMNLRRIEQLRAMFAGVPVGLSDHSPGFLAAQLGVALGASVVEKHIMASGCRSLDSEFALDAYEFARMVQAVRLAESALDTPSDDVERDSKVFRRRLVYAKDVEAGTLLTSEHVTTARAKEGCMPANMPTTAKTDAKAGDPVV